MTSRNATIIGPARMRSRSTCGDRPAIPASELAATSLLRLEGLNVAPVIPEIRRRSAELHTPAGIPFRPHRNSAVSGRHIINHPAGRSPLTRYQGSCAVG